MILSLSLFDLGSEIDVTKLKEFFTKIGYEVKCAPEDMTKEELQNFLLKIEKSYLTDNSKKYYSFICVIMSHGHEVSFLNSYEYL